ncbi:MAG: AraC family transcriptional regulator [Lachnospiraceae bacterium]|nr:AraC family transcriptional regulator [Lachnospiraceae bacterium]
MDILNEFDCDELHYRYALDESPKEADYAFHVHDKCEIFYFVSGGAQYLVEGSVYPLERGTLLIMMPNEAHCPQILSDEQYERFAVNFPLSLFDSIDSERRLMSPFTKRLFGRENMYTLPGLETVFEKMGEGADMYEKKLNLTTSLLSLLTIIRSAFLGKEKEKMRIQTPAESIVSYVNEHLYEEITIDSLCSRFFVSSSKLQRMFKHSTGASVWEFITAKRLAAVRGMLSNGMPAGEASQKCGFGDYSSFYRAYVKRYKETPSEKHVKKEDFS